MLCGKIASGKSTLAARLGRTPRTVVVVQDRWMAHLWSEELRTVADYARLVPRLRAAMGPHVADVLGAGLSVALDWPANTAASRRWMRGIFEVAGAAHLLHVLDVPDEVCRARMHARNASGAHEFAVDDAVFDEMAAFFEPPPAEEGFETRVHRAGA